MTAKLNRHLCQSMWMREKIRFSTFRKKSGFQTPLLSNTCAQRRRTRRSKRRKRRRSEKRLVRSLKSAAQSREKLRTSMTFHAKCCNYAWKADLHHLHSSKSRFFFKKKNYSMNADSNGDGVWRRRQSAFKVWRRFSTETLLRGDESCRVWRDQLCCDRREEGGSRRKIKTTLVSHCKVKEKKNSPFFFSSDIRRPHVFTFSPLPSPPRLQSKHLQVANAALSPRFILRLHKDLCEKRRFLDNFNSLFSFHVIAVSEENKAEWGRV